MGRQYKKAKANRRKAKKSGKYVKQRDKRTKEVISNAKVFTPFRNLIFDNMKIEWDD